MRVLTIGLVVCLSVGAAQAQGIWVEYPEDGDGAQLGMGWDMRAGAKISRVCVEGGRPIVDRYQTKYATIGRVWSKEQLYRGLDISVAAQVKHLAGGSAEGKVSYASSRDVRSETTTVAVHARVSNGPHYIGLPMPSDAQSAGAGQRREADLARISAARLRLEPEADKLWKRNRPAFLKACGSHYVAAFREGAELIGFMTASSLDERERRTLSASLSGSAFGVTASSDVTSTVNALKQIKSFKFEVRDSGGWGGTLANDGDRLIRAVRDLPKVAADAPKRFQLLAMPYAVIMREAHDGDPEAAAIDGLMNRTWRLSALQADFLAADEHRSQYLFGWGVSRDLFDKKLAELMSAVGAAQSAALKCHRAGGCKQALDALPSPLDFSPYMPLRKESFTADRNLRDSAKRAKDAVERFDDYRRGDVKLGGPLNPVLRAGADCRPVEALYERAMRRRWFEVVWPTVAAYERRLRNYPAQLKAEIAERRLGGPWRRYCRFQQGDPDCIPIDQLRKRQNEIQVKSRGAVKVNGTGTPPGGEATQCRPGLRVVFAADLD